MPEVFKNDTEDVLFRLTSGKNSLYLYPVTKWINIRKFQLNHK